MPTESSMLRQVLIDRIKNADKEQLTALLEDVNDIRTIIISQMKEIQSPKFTTQHFEMAYDRKNNILLVGLPKTEIDEDFLKYFMEFNEIPTDAKIVYKT